MKTNIGEAILILGSVYFILSYEISWYECIGLILLIGLSVFSWEKVYHPKELKDLVLAQIDEIRTRTDMMKVQAKLFIAQTVYWMKRRN